MNVILQMSFTHILDHQMCDAEQSLANVMGVSTRGIKFVCHWGYMIGRTLATLAPNSKI